MKNILKLADSASANNMSIRQDRTEDERSPELLFAYRQLALQKQQIETSAAELIVADRELVFQNKEKAARASELVIAHKELLFENREKEKRASELIIANKELIFQNEEKAMRAAELVIANKELLFQNREKEKRASELIIANKELIFQNEEKADRASELIIANKELLFQNCEKEKRASELIIANKELVFQNCEKEKRAAELLIANKELEQFAYIASHDLQEPLRTISNYMQLFKEDYLETMDADAGKYIDSVNEAAGRMAMLIKALLDFSRLGRHRRLAYVDCGRLIKDVIADLQSLITGSKTAIFVGEMPSLNVYEVELRQVFQNLIANAIKFQKAGSTPDIEIRCERADGRWRFSVKDNGIGIEKKFFQKIFDIFQRLHSEVEFKGSGIGLANIKKIVAIHQGEIWVESTPGRGSTFNFTIGDL